jgi:hypothetical protein
VIQSGIILVLSGLLKKMVFADRFAVVSDGYFNNPSAHPGWLAAWSGCTPFSCKSSSTSLVTPTSLVVAQSCWALSFHLTLRVLS